MAGVYPATGRHEHAAYLFPSTQLSIAKSDTSNNVLAHVASLPDFLDLVPPPRCSHT